MECGAATVDDRAALDTAFAKVMEAAESEWCSMTDQVDEAGLPKKAASGRGEGPVYKWLPVIPAMPNDGLGKTDDVGLGLDLLATYFAEMAGILARCSKLPLVPPAASARWKAITALLRGKEGSCRRWSVLTRPAGGGNVLVLAA